MKRISFRIPHYLWFGNIILTVFVVGTLAMSVKNVIDIIQGKVTSISQILTIIMSIVFSNALTMVLWWIGVSRIIRIRKEIKQKLQQYGKDTLIQEVKNHTAYSFRSFGAGKTYLTERFIISPVNGIVSYDEIKEVNEFIEHSLYSTSYRYLLVKRKDGKEMKLTVPNQRKMFEKCLAYCRQQIGR